MKTKQKAMANMIF